MATRQEKVSAGLFLLTGVLLISAVVALIIGLKVRGRYVDYTVRFTKSVKGLSTGADVFLSGVVVGSVKQIDFDARDRGTVVVTIQVNQRHELPAGTYATLDTNVLTGGTDIALLIEDHSSREIIEPGSEIPWGETPLMAFESSLSDLSQAFPSTLMEMRETFVRINQVLNPENQVALRNLFHNGDQLVRTTEQEIRMLGAEVRELRKSVDAVANGILGEVLTFRRQMLDSLDRGIDAAALAADGVSSASKSVTAFGEDLGATAKNFNEVATQLQQSIGLLDAALIGGDRMLGENRRNIQGALEDLRYSARSLRSFLEELERNPAAILGLNDGGEDHGAFD